MPRSGRSRASRRTSSPPAASSPTFASTGTSRPRPEATCAAGTLLARRSRIAAERHASQPTGWGRELDTFARAFGGAFLFGIPLLYTQETWNIGTYLDAGQLLGMLVLTFAAVLALAHVSGFRSGEARDHFATDLEEAVEALAVGAVGSVVVLVALARLGPADPPDLWIRLIALQTVPLAVGAALGNALLADRGSLGDGRTASQSSELRALVVDVAATAFGAFFLSFNIAPTEEVQLVASEASLIHLVALIVLSLLIGYAIVFEAEFVGIGRRRAQAGPFQHPITETTLAYCVSLGVAAAMLLLLGRMELGDPVRDLVAQTIVLGLPAAIGGAAGRLVV